MSIKLLIVDDSALIRSRLHRLLRSVSGIASIREAATPYEALESVQFDPPTLVILDPSLPDGFGTRIIQQLTQSFPTLWIAVLTFHADPSRRLHCLALGAHWFFDKATEIDDLLEVVRRLASANGSPSLEHGQDLCT